MDELEEIRQRKMEDLQRQLQLEGPQTEEAQVQQQLEALESLVRNFLDKDALARYGALKTAHPEKASQLLLILGQAIHSGTVKEKLTDEQLKDILRKITPQKKDTRIQRK